MKKSPFSSIIDLNSEQKEYGRLCKYKSKKYKLYTEWEEHIAHCLSKFNTKKDLYNFKRYCMNRERTSSKIPEMFVIYITLLIPLYVEKMTDGFSPIMLICAALLAVCCLMICYKRIIHESYFFKDLIEVIERQEIKIKE